MFDHEYRKELLNNLIQFKGDIKLIKDELLKFGWDIEKELVSFNKSHLKRVLERYIRGELDESDIYEWSNLIESREDIDFERLGGESLINIIFELANPEINNGFNKQRAEEILQTINDVPGLK